MKRLLTILSMVLFSTSAAFSGPTTGGWGYIRVFTEKVKTAYYKDYYTIALDGSVTRYNVPGPYYGAEILTGHDHCTGAGVLSFTIESDGITPVKLSMIISGGFGTNAYGSLESGALRRVEFGKEGSTAAIVLYAGKGSGITSYGAYRNVNIPSDWVVSDASSIGTPWNEVTHPNWRAIWDTQGISGYITYKATLILPQGKYTLTSECSEIVDQTGNNPGPGTIYPGTIYPNQVGGGTAEISVIPQGQTPIDGPSATVSNSLPCLEKIVLKCSEGWENNNNISLEKITLDAPLESLDRTPQTSAYTNYSIGDILTLPAGKFKLTFSDQVGRVTPEPTTITIPLIQ